MLQLHIIITGYKFNRNCAGFQKIYVYSYSTVFPARNGKIYCCGRTKKV